VNIVGLGTAGCNIAQCFSKYPQYKIFFIDTEDRTGNLLKIDRQKSLEDYESNAPNVTEFLKDSGGDITFIVGGSGSLSTMTLAILEQIREKNITIVYIQPKLSSLTGKKKLLERATSAILQQYARSGLFKGIYLINNQNIVEIAGQLPVIGYHNKVNDIICTSIHFINVLDNTKHIYGNVGQREDVCTISTIGLLDVETSEETLFFELDMIREKDYMYTFNRNRLLENSNIISLIEAKMEKKTEAWLTNISYRLYPTEYDSDFGYCVFRTSKVQGELDEGL
tara:strand:- start:9728 stop:10573 length:846 start_codon:yes stop_codon:yes gene_type:complete